jgi:hypothetical protein
MAPMRSASEAALKHDATIKAKQEGWLKNNVD